MDAIRTTLFTMGSDIRYFLYAGFQNLPLSIAGIMIIIGFFTANYGMVFFSIGYLVIFPAALYAFNLLPLSGLVTNASACDFLPSTDFLKESTRTEPYQGIGYWIPMTFFFIGYILTNAVLMYTTPPALDQTGSTTNGVPKWIDASGNPLTADNASAGLANRQTNTMVAMVVIVLLAILCIAIRSTECEGPLALVIGVLGGGFSGCGWYYFLQGIANQRVSDLFGMANRLLSPYALSNQPYACLPTGSE